MQAIPIVAAPGGRGAAGFRAPARTARFGVLRPSGGGVMPTRLDVTKDYYALFGIPAESGPEAVKRAYRQLARQYHPDAVARGEGESYRRFERESNLYMAEINEGYEVLMDPQAREMYDLSHALPAPAQAPAQAPTQARVPSPAPSGPARPAVAPRPSPGTTADRKPVSPLNVLIWGLGLYLLSFAAVIVFIVARGLGRGLGFW